MDHPLGAWAIDGDGLLHECVHALFDGRGEVWHAKTRGCCEDRKVAGTQAVQRLLVGIKTKEDPFLGNIDAFWKLLQQAFAHRTDVIWKHVSHCY